MSESSSTEPSEVQLHLRREWEALDDAYRHRYGPGEEHELYREIAESFRPGVHTLTVTPELLRKLRALREEYGTLEGVSDTEAVQALVEHPIVREGLELRLAFDSIASIAKAQGRLADLLLLLDKREFTDIVAEYVRRAVRLFLWGLDSEAVVMCGASLEAAYREQFPDLTMLQLQIRKDGPAFEASQYEQAAVAAGVYSREELQQARRIRRARNDIVHRTADTDLPVRDALPWTVGLLGRLLR